MGVFSYAVKDERSEAMLLPKDLYHYGAQLVGIAKVCYDVKWTVFDILTLLSIYNLN